MIAEVKRRSPSKGDLAVGLDPADLATRYEQGGAACMSVLTDESFFGGSGDDLRLARSACSMPVLRKDFTVCLADVFDARVMGADCLLLIVAALSDSELKQFHSAAVGVGLDVLVEIHDEAELDRALAAGATTSTALPPCCAPRSRGTSPRATQGSSPTLCVRTPRSRCSS